jgi:phage-related protein
VPEREVVFYQDRPGDAPVLEWLENLRRNNERAYAKCVAKIERLAELGQELRRPEADYLRDGVYELRSRFGTVNYRILYFFHGRTLAVLAHALTKKAKVPTADINRALGRKAKFESDPETHTYESNES